jgi:hypothetical protein
MLIAAALRVLTVKGHKILILQTFCWNYNVFEGRVLILEAIYDLDDGWIIRLSSRNQLSTFFPELIANLL